MEFIDRQDELQRLRRAGAREGGLVVLWGRRRVGKTRLLVEWCGQEGLYWVADTSAAPLQIRNFAETVAARLPGFADVDYRDWATLLRRLAREARAATFRGPLIIDELPYLLGSSPELPSVLQSFVDHDLKQARLVLALAGSSQRMMQGLTLSSEAPLYGRATELFKLHPLPPGCIVDVLGGGDAAEAVRAFAIWGGIPRYWELAAPFGDLRQAVDALVLDPMAPLHEEPNRLLLEETPSALALRPILDVIGAGAHRVSEIASRIGQPATSLARPLARLQELDLVLRETPFGDPERGTKRALYKLADPFLALWFSLVAPKRSALVQLPRPGRLRLFDAAFPGLVASVWEGLCRQAVPRLEATLGAEHGPAARHWSAGGHEWDIVAESVAGGALARRSQVVRQGAERSRRRAHGAGPDGQGPASRGAREARAALRGVRFEAAEGEAEAAGERHAGGRARRARGAELNDASNDDPNQPPAHRGRDALGVEQGVGELPDDARAEPAEHVHRLDADVRPRDEGDHEGRQAGLGIVDFGCFNAERCDYPDYCRPAAEAVRSGECHRCIVFGGSGNGEAIVANRVPGMRTPLCWSLETARLGREHNDANGLALGARVIDQDLALAIVRVWLDTPFEGGRHLPRIQKIDDPK